MYHLGTNMYLLGVNKVHRTRGGFVDSLKYFIIICKIRGFMYLY